MLTPETVGLSPDDAAAYASTRRFLEYQRKVLTQLRPVWPVPARILSDAFFRLRSEAPRMAVISSTALNGKPWNAKKIIAEQIGDSVWSQQDLVALVADAWDEFPNYLRVVPMKDVTPTALLKKDPADNPVMRAYFKLLSLLPDQAVLVFPVLHHGNWVAHNLGIPPFPQPAIRAVLPAVAKNRRNIEIMPIAIFAKEWTDGKEED